ncbi:N-acetylmuramoyl-L-alanine amidase [Haloactinopolyspora alba]|uniref:N-acetylmuramoyl-L-alanine amidase n=1 Tax=Haloactinopolyspora alba TaxID=648780 RepID=A0A2P8DJ75_9ACTN|nr:N-acetylmuramoyl-L-alanine amidase [Haloactinopolyspora alba]PSK97244.1 N-acetylmuramoyl-L-alanine amidase [Haloactinopolyspora alba]
MTPTPSRRTVLATGVALAATPVVTTAANAAGNRIGPAANLGRAFSAAAARHGVPRDVLLALAHTVTHVNGHGGAPSAYGGHGVMQLVRGAGTDTLGRAAELTGRSARALRTDPAANVDGAAALLRSLADAAGLGTADRRDVGAWYEPLARYSGHSDPAVARLEADAVYRVLESGLSVHRPGESLRMRAHDVRPRLGAFRDVRTVEQRMRPMSADYPPARWVAAHSSNYRDENRPSDYAIDRVVVHTVQGSYAGCISWFQNPSSNVSAHYVVRSSDGEVTQMVRHADVAWHVGNYNNRSIGIEHEGWVDDPSWYTEAMYRASAALTRHVCVQYGIPLDRTHIIAHSEAPGATHTDPGPHWDWAKYMDYVRGDGGSPSWSVVVDNDSPAFEASSNWVSASAPGQYGSTHHHAQPVLSSDVAWFHADIPETADYRVQVWYPEDPGNNSRSPHLVSTPSGFQSVYVDQRSGGGRWVGLGTFTLEQGNRPVVGVSRWTSTSGSIEADAVRISSLD